MSGGCKKTETIIKSLIFPNLHQSLWGTDVGFIAGYLNSQRLTLIHYTLSRNYHFILCFAKASWGLITEACCWRTVITWKTMLSPPPVSFVHILYHCFWALTFHGKDNVTLLALGWHLRQMPSTTLYQQHPISLSYF